MAVQLSHPQGAYVCGFCSFTSPDYRVLVRHLMDHCGFKEKKHEHVLWCGLCKPSLTDANQTDGHQQAMTHEIHFGESTYYDNDSGYGEASNYYPGYNGLYNPYAYPSACYYPVNIAYRSPCYGNVNGYYQTHNTIFYTDDFYDGTDIFSFHNTPRFIESAPEDKYLLDAPHNAENTHNADSFTRSLNEVALSDLERNSSDANAVNFDSGFETLPVDPQIFPAENSLNEFSIGEMGTFSKNTENAELNVDQPIELETISPIKPQLRVNKSNIQPTSESLSRNLSGTQAKKLSSKGIPDPKLNAIKLNSFETNAHKANHTDIVHEDLQKSSNLGSFSEVGSKGAVSSIVYTNSGIRNNSIDMNANTKSISVSNNGCYLKLPTEKLAEPSESMKASSTKELVSVSIREEDCIEKTIINDASDVKICSTDIEVDTLSKTALTKECTSPQLRICEREATSENALGEGSIPAQDINSVPISNAKLSPKVNTTILTEDASYNEAQSINENCPLAKIDLNEIHSERPTGKLETLNSISALSENDTPAVELSPKINVMIVRENKVSDIKIKSINMNRDPKTKKKVLSDSKRKTISFEIDRRNRVKNKTYEDALSRNSQRKRKDNCTGAITESSNFQSDETGALSNVDNNLRNSRRSDLNCTNKNSGSAPVHYQGRLTYSEVVKRGLPLKSSS